MSKINYCPVCKQIFLGDYCTSQFCSNNKPEEIKVAEDTMFEKEITTNMPDEYISKIIPEG